MLKFFNIELKYGENINFADGGNKHVSDFEHNDIARVRAKENLSMASLANGGHFEVEDKKIILEKRSRETIFNVIHNHDDDIAAMGYCSICARVNDNDTARQKLLRK